MASEYWRENVNQVENTLYRIPAGVITKRSGIFADMLALPADNCDLSEGQTDQRPIHLEGHSSQEFDCLMAYLWDG